MGDTDPGRFQRISRNLFTFHSGGEYRQGRKVRGMKKSPPHERPGEGRLGTGVETATVKGP